MAISLRAAGTATAANVGLTAVNPSVPTGATTGDLSVLTVWIKPYSTVITTPSGWTKIGEYSNGTVAAGTDVGSTKVAVFVKESAAVGAIGAIVFDGSQVSCGAVINTYQKSAAGIWDYSAWTSGGDAANGANYSATGAAGIDVAAGDWVFQGTAVNGDVGTQSAQTIGGMSGATLGTYVVRQSADTTTGSDSHGEVGDRPVTAGSSTAAPTFTYTNTSSGSGSTIWLRLREVIPTPVSRAMSTSWNVLETVSVSRSTLWNVFAEYTAVSRASSTSWHVYKTVSASRSTLWNVRDIVSASRSTLWNVRKTVSTSRSTSWNVVGRVSKATSTSWNVVGRVSKSTSTLWTVRNTVSRQTSTSWNVRGLVTKAVSTFWNVEESLFPVSMTFSTKWNVIGRVAASRSTSWNVLNTVSKATSTSWHVYTSVSKAYSTLWNTREFVSRAYSTYWNTRDGQWALWNGTELEDLWLEGVWNGSSVDQVSTWTGEMKV